jgi:hypothetical protein
MDIAEKDGVTGNQERQCREAAEKRHPRRAVLLDQRNHPGREIVDRRNCRRRAIPFIGRILRRLPSQSIGHRPIFCLLRWQFG